MQDLFSTDNIWKLLVAAAAMVALLFWLLKSARAGLLLLGGMLFLSGLGLTKEVGDSTEYRTWLFPLQAQRPILFAGAAAMIYLGLFAHANLVNMRKTAPLAWLNVLLGVTMGLITIVQTGGSATGPVAGFYAIAFAIFSMMPIILLYSAILHEWNDWVSVIRALAIAGAVWTGACTVQFLIDQNVLLTGVGRRFVGLSGNPQHAAGFSAVIAVCATWLVLNDPLKRWKLVWLFVAASHVVFVLWSGSRTGAIVSLAGFTAIFYARMGKGVLFAPVLAAGIYGLVALATEMGVKFGFERLTSSQDTRSDKWITMFENGLANPIAGVGLEEAGGSENGFLYGFSSYGILVPLVMLAMMAVTGVVCLRLVRARFGASAMVKRLIDLHLGMFIMYWLGNMAEGYAVARISPQLLFFLTFASTSHALLVKMRDEAEVSAEFQGEPVAVAEGQDYSWYGQNG